MAHRMVALSGGGSGTQMSTSGRCYQQLCARCSHSLYGRSYSAFLVEGADIRRGEGAGWHWTGYPKGVLHADAGKSAGSRSRDGTGLWVPEGCPACRPRDLSGTHTPVPSMKTGDLSGQPLTGWHWAVVPQGCPACRHRDLGGTHTPVPSMKARGSRDVLVINLD
ncbi:hypothetical protein NDU88_011403 [Pleurodeles waltl]|uniref:Uncharacterized protein n=1 Tax=Pleurodeles waltl TaxID=8319 RepID=A0AAV7Q1J1_PLEWA|nr:hypothetical protein NDU88_011403 [Pleurodeles waltl]